MSRIHNETPAWVLSILINLSILGTLHFVSLSQAPAETVAALTSVIDEPVPELQRQEEFRFSNGLEETTGEISEISVGVAGAGGMSGHGVQFSRAPLQDQVGSQAGVGGGVEVPRLTEGSLARFTGDITQRVEIKGHVDDAAGGVGGAMDRVAFEIRQSLRERKTLVVWLFDASGSLKDQRREIAGRFDNIYRQLGETGTTDGLYSVVVSYGEQAEMLTPEPIQDVRELSDVVRTKIKEDRSGVENVFSAVRQVVEKFRGWRRSEGPWNKLVFIVTDERGDDADHLLEDVISLAKRSQTRVFTIGNAAIFGRREGYVRWVDTDGYVGYIPVDQGPETAFPDGLQFPFIGSGEDWRLRQMSSSYGPYALSRLCSETGGIYLVKEDPHGFKFDRDVMRRYAPDYRPARQQQQEISSNRAKSSLVQAAAFTYDEDLPTPQVVFRAYNDTTLRNDITGAQRPAAAVDITLRRMLETLSVGEKDRENLREDRWRAAYDLAIGRVLAMRVRFVGYNQMLADMKSSPKPFSNEKNNMWRLRTTGEISAGPQIRKAADQARMYLQRVMDEHPGTPWAALAEKELQSDLGWAWEDFSQPIPGSDVFRASEAEVAMLLLAEENRRPRRPPVTAKPRNPPKL